MKSIEIPVFTALTMAFVVLTIGFTPPACAGELQSAARNGETAEVKKLLDEGADVNSISDNPLTIRMTPLMSAAMKGHTDTMALLLDRGAKLELTTPGKYGGMTALMIAAAHGHPEAVKLLIARGANLKAVSNPVRRGLLVKGHPGKDALTLARESRCNECATLLEQAEKDEPQKQLLARQAAERATRMAALGRRLNPAAAEAEEKTADEALLAGNFNEALAHYMAAMQAAPSGGESDERLRKRTIQAVLAMTPPPPVPEKATHHALRGKAFVELAIDADGYNKALFELEQAVEIAPWFADAYFNLGLIEEKVNNFTGAIRNLKLYLLAAPGSADAKAVQQKIIKLEVKQELKEGK